MNHVNPTHFERIPPLVDGEQGLVNAIIETPRDTRLKFAFEHEFGIFKLKQVLADGLQWPYDYGFIPQTLAGDGDPLDVLVLTDIPTFTGCLVACRILGLVRLEKDGEENDRVLAAPEKQRGVAQASDGFEDVDDIPKETLESISRFLIEYSEEQGHCIEFKGVKSKKKAIAALETAMRAYERGRP
jgi:inorganic pyrophosphatase